MIMHMYIFLAATKTVQSTFYKTCHALNLEKIQDVDTEGRKPVPQLLLSCVHHKASRSWTGIREAQLAPWS